MNVDGSKDTVCSVTCHPAKVTFRPCVLASRSWERTSACYQQLIRDCSRDADAVSVLRAHLRRYLVYSRPCLDRSQRSECIVGRNVRWPRSRLVLRAPPSHAEHTPRMTPDNAEKRRDRQTDGPTDRRQTVALWYSLFTMNCSTQQYSTHTHIHTHTRLMAFFRDYPGEPVPEGKTNLDLTGARDSEWQWHQLGHMQVCTSLQTDNHTNTHHSSFLQAGCPSCRPTTASKH